MDDVDERIVYGGPTGAWAKACAENEFGATTQNTRTARATATYKFNGTGIGVYGTLGVEENVDQFTATFTIDNHQPVLYTPNSRDLRYRTRFFQSPILYEGEHTLEIKDTTENARAIVLDYFVQSVSPVSLTAKKVPSGPSSDPSSPFPGPTAGTPSGLPKEARYPNVALISGLSTVGALLLFTIIIGFFVWTRRRSLGRSRRIRLNLAGPKAPELKPFLATSGRIVQRASSHRSSGSSAQSLVEHDTTVAAGKGLAHARPNPVHAPAHPVPSSPKQHQGGGVRLAVGEKADDADEPRDDLPPVYQVSYSS